MVRLDKLVRLFGLDRFVMLGWSLYSFFFGDCIMVHVLRPSLLLSVILGKVSSREKVSRECRSRDGRSRDGGSRDCRCMFRRFLLLLNPTAAPLPGLLPAVFVMRLFTWRLWNAYRVDDMMTKNCCVIPQWQLTTWQRGLRGFWKMVTFKYYETRTNLSISS
jgi:hypothetical protein